MFLRNCCIVLTERLYITDISSSQVLLVKFILEHAYTHVRNNSHNTQVHATILAYKQEWILLVMTLCELN